MDISFFNFLIGFLIILCNVGFFLLLLGLITKAHWCSWVSRHAPQMLFVLYGGAVAGSLVYEHVFNFEPCSLCWWQRIFIYGSAVLLGRALILKKSVLGEVLTLSLFGLAFALLHNLMDIFQLSNISLCSSEGDGSLCLVRYVYQFGYLTIPMMSLSVLALGSLLAFMGNKAPRSKDSKLTLLR